MPPRPLPRIMVAPNGARRGRGDHPAIPLTDDEIVREAAACHAAGAGGIHAHLRDEGGRHLLDAGRYRALSARLAEEVPGLYVQITSEAAGRYEPAEQRAMVRDARPAHVSVALREMVRAPGDWPEASAFYAWAAREGTDVQHILYDARDVDAFLGGVREGLVPGRHHLVQLVLGTYAGDVPSRPGDLEGLVAPLLGAADLTFDWMLCAFGPAETACLVEAARLGGKMRVGFENSLWNADGSLAASNEERVRALRAALGD